MITCAINILHMQLNTTVTFKYFFIFSILKYINYYNLKIECVLLVSRTYMITHLAIEKKTEDVKKKVDETLDLLKGKSNKRESCLI